MVAPDRRLFEADIESAEFRTGVITRRWGVPEELLSAAMAWPTRVLWITAATRPASPDRFYISLDLCGYRAASPTGTFWDPLTQAPLELAKRPKGREGSRFAMVFRTDWNDGRAFYHPYDRVATAGHSNWSSEHPSHIWTSNHTIVDYLWEFHGLLNSGDYLGV